MISSNASRPTTPTNADLADAISIVLASPRRHHVLSALASRSDHRSSFDDLAVAVSAFERVECDEHGAEPPNSDVAVDLYHRHLPKLAEAGIIEQRDVNGDGDGTVEMTEIGRECARALGIGRGVQ